MYENLEIQNNVIKAAFDHKVRKLLFLGSSCIYPKMCPQPIKEEYLLSGYLEPTNEGYALAKISGLKMCQFFKRQFSSHYISPERNRKIALCKQRIFNGSVFVRFGSY